MSTNPSDHPPRMRRPAVVLAFLAPAERCNQRCPGCVLTEVLDEPVHYSGLGPVDYALFVRQLIDTEVPIRALNFQGYEVTLPSSWAYLEAVFRVAQENGLRYGFVTNGMLLARRTARIVALDPHRISISLDGATPETNDRLRGLPGAFRTTTRNVRDFIAAAPHFAKRLSVASCLHDQENFLSLREMPALLTQLGVSRWTVSAAVHLSGDEVQPTTPLPRLLAWLEELQMAAERSGLRFHVNNELGVIRSSRGPGAALQTRQLFDPRFYYRFDTRGYVRIGRETLTPWHPDEDRRWSPNGRNAAAVVGYEEFARATQSARSPTEPAPARTRRPPPR